MSRGAFIIGGTLGRPAPNVRRRSGIDTGDAGGSSLIPAFSPLGITKLSEWFSVESLVAGGAGPVGAWAGEKGLYTLAASTTARPTFVANDGDGMPSVQFDGVDDQMVSRINNHSLYGPVGNFELWFVIKGLSAGAGTRGFWFNGGITMGMSSVAQTTPRVLFYAPGAGPAASGVMDVQDDAWHVVRLTRNGPAHSFYLDGALINTQSPGAGTWLDGEDDMLLGSVGGSSYWHGGYRHALFFKGQLTTDEAAAMTTYLEGWV